MPPQQVHRLLDFVDNGLMFGAHVLSIQKLIIRART
jgi:hypothetical protein